ncbi:hypothetical protein BC826DRAFT_505545 [Russula brevipes]|nr:hypothetical protein BC826DRAFT_505545 [Russula brevipes]
MSVPQHVHHGIPSPSCTRAVSRSLLFGSIVCLRESPIISIIIYHRLRGVVSCHVMSLLELVVLAYLRAFARLYHNHVRVF